MGAFLGSMFAVFFIALWFSDDISKITKALKRIADALEEKKSKESG